MPAHNASQGFSLVEALVASLIAATALVGAVHLIAAGATQSLAARRATTARALAQSKLEHLRSLAWGYDADGAPLTSSDLSLSPAASLTEDSDGFVERLDRFGATAGPEVVPHYRRRWAILPFAGDPDTLTLGVCVLSTSRGASEQPEACVWTIRTRRP